MKYLVAFWLMAMTAFVFAGVGAAGQKPTVKDYTPAELEAFARDDSDTQAAFKVGIPISPREVAKAVAVLKANPNAQITEEGSLNVPFQKMAGTAGTAESSSTMSVAANVCWSRTDLNFSRGTWPVNRGVTEYRYWCAHGVGGLQYYRSTAVDTQSGVCSTSSKNTFRVNGGNGYRFTVVRTEAWFNCAPGFNTATRQNWSCNTHGNCAREWDNDWAWWE